MAMAMVIARRVMMGGQGLVTSGRRFKGQKRHQLFF
jgi:hypothetical protein